MALDSQRATDNTIAILGGLRGSPEQKAISKANIKAIHEGLIAEILANGLVATTDSNGDTCADGKIT